MQRIPLIIGPTAVGKTSVAIQLATSLEAEIVSVDSRQVYRELNVATAKPSIDEQNGIVHHFVDEVSLPQVVSAGWFERQANRRITDILERGTQVVAVGGSTLYIHALTDGLADVPAVANDIVDELNSSVVAGFSKDLFAELTRVDPAFAATLDASKSQRLVRGLSVYRSTGKPLSSFFDTARAHHKFNVVLLQRPREQLYERINRRAASIVSDGLVDEARGLLEAGFDPDLSPLRTIGYREAFDYIHGRTTDEQELLRLLQRNTRRYAKRQMTWMRRYSDSCAVDADASPDRILDFAQR